MSTKHSALNAWEWANEIKTRSSRHYMHCLYIWKLKLEEKYMRFTHSLIISFYLKQTTLSSLTQNCQPLNISLAGWTCEQVFQV